MGWAAIGSVEDGLLAHSPDNKEPRPIASIAKLIAALAIMQATSGRTDESYTLTHQDVEISRTYIARGGVVLPAREGLVLTLRQALQAMLIGSASDVTDILIERVFGSMAAYLLYARAMLHRMQLGKTVVADASGFNPNTVSTPSELVTIGIAALKNPMIAEIVAQPKVQIPGVKNVITNRNKLFGVVEGVIGIKTGATAKAGSCLLFAARHIVQNKRKMTIVAAIMGGDSKSIYSDSKNLLASAKVCYDMGVI
jgi:D-alanyl-D-alanine carboxypeptidase (penicillin-binding protein 5/6)